MKLEIAHVGNNKSFKRKVALYSSTGFLRMSCNLLWSRSRIAVYYVLTASLCRCGCNGACTLDPLTIVVNWSVNWLQRAANPPCRHDGALWLPSDDARKRTANEPLPMRGALVELRADWPERAAMSGCKTHQGSRPCMRCTCTKTDFHDGYDECTPTSLPWANRDHSEYMLELASLLVPVVVDDEARNAN